MGLVSNTVQEERAHLLGLSHSLVSLHLLHRDKKDQERYNEGALINLEGLKVDTYCIRRQQRKYGDSSRLNSLYGTGPVLFRPFHLNRAIFLFSYVLYSTLLHLAPLKFHCVGGCWDRTQDYSIATLALAVRRSNY